MVFNSVLVLSQFLREKYNVALLLLCTYEKTNDFLSPTEFWRRCFRSRRGFHGKGVRDPPPLYSEMYTT